MNLMQAGSQHVVNTFLVVFDLTGTFVFALSGATAAVKHNSMRLGSWYYASLRLRRAESHATS